MRYFFATISFAFLIFLCAHSSCFACTTSPPAIPSSSAPVTVLHILPYPDIPGNFKRMLEIIRCQFEKENPDIALQFTHSKVSDAYDINRLTEWLTAPVPSETARPPNPIVEPTPGTGVDIAEIDTMMLGALAAKKILGQPILTECDWHPTAIESSSINGVLQGTPHWLCGNFVLSRSKQLTEADSIEQFATTIKAIKPHPPYLSGNYAGSSFFVLNYLQAWAGNSPESANLQTALNGNIDIRTINTLKVATGLCTESDTNPCIDEQYYKNPDQYISRTVKGDYAALMGFSESMWYLAMAGADPAEWHIGPLPLGETNENILLADTFVTRKGLSLRKREAIERFLKYLMRDSVYTEIMLSGGPSGTRIPRYIIPARPSVLSLPCIAKDAYYRRIARQLSGTRYYPNQDIPEARERIYNMVMPLLRSPLSTQEHA